MLAVLLAGPVALTSCGAQIDRHGHVFIDINLQDIQPGQSKEEIKTVLGSPDTTSSIGGDAWYYISTTQKTVAFMKPYEIDRQVLAVYFDGSENVQKVGHYGMEDGIVINYFKGETPARGNDLTLLNQLVGGMQNRQMFKDQSKSKSGSGIPGPGL